MRAAAFDPQSYLEPRPAPRALVRTAQVLVAIGAASLVGGLLAGDGRSIRIAWLTNTVYFLDLGLGAAAFAAALQITQARWGRPLKRVAEALVLLAPVMWLSLLVLLLTGGLDLYEWKTHPEILHGHKATWLTPAFFVVRQAVGLAILTVVALVFVRHSLRPDLGAAAEKLGDRAPAWWARLTLGWQGAQAEVEASQRRMFGLAPVVAILFGLVVSLLAFDVLMSLAPHWYANMFGGWHFASSFWLALVWVGVISLAYRRWLGIEDVLTPAVYHDLGKLVFGFSMFWAYTLFAQLLPIWYGNMTEEIGYLLVRMSLEPWQGLSIAVLALCFAIPFLTLLSRGLKKMPRGFLFVLVLVAIGIWLERFDVIAPSAWHEAHLPLGPFELGLTAGFVGIALWITASFLGSVPAVPATDPYMLPHPEDVHVVPGGQVHAH